MAKLSTNDIRKELIDFYMSQEHSLTNYIAAGMDSEMDRIKLDMFNWTPEQLAENKAWARKRKGPRPIFEEYFTMKSDKWLRELHKREVRSKESA